MLHTAKAVSFEGRILWVVLNLLLIFINRFRSTSYFRIGVAAEGMCSKAKQGTQAIWEAAISPGAWVCAATS